MSAHDGGYGLAFLYLYIITRHIDQTDTVYRGPLNAAIPLHHFSEHMLTSERLAGLQNICEPRSMAGQYPDFI